MKAGEPVPALIITDEESPVPGTGEADHGWAETLGHGVDRQLDATTRYATSNQGDPSLSSLERETQTPFFAQEILKLLQEDWPLQIRQHEIDAETALAVGLLYGAVQLEVGAIEQAQHAGDQSDVMRE